MTVPVFNKYFSFNTIIYTVFVELFLTIPIVIFFIFPTTFWFFLFLLFAFSVYIVHLYIIPFFILLIPVECYLRKKGHIVKYNIVNIPVKLQKYIYIFTTLIYVIITIIGAIVGQPMTEEELLYD